MIRISHLGSSRKRVSHLFTGAQKWLLCLRWGVRLGFFTGETNGSADKAPKRTLCRRTLWDSQVLWAGCLRGYFHVHTCGHQPSDSARQEPGFPALWVEWRSSCHLVRPPFGWLWVPLNIVSERAVLMKILTFGIQSQHSPQCTTLPDLFGAHFIWSVFYLPPTCCCSVSSHGFLGSWDDCWYRQRS